MATPSRGGVKTASALSTMSLIPSKILKRLRRIFELPVPSSSYPPPRPEPPELWHLAKDMMNVFPVGSVGRGEIVGVFVNRLKQKPALIARLHPATSPFHLALVNEIVAHAEMTPELRAKMLENPEITALLL